MLSDICMSMRNKESRCDFFSGRNSHWYHDSHKRDILLSNEKIHDIVDTSSARERKRERSRGVIGNEKISTIRWKFRWDFDTHNWNRETKRKERETRERDLPNFSNSWKKKIFGKFHEEQARGALLESIQYEASNSKLSLNWRKYDGWWEIAS